MIALRTLRSLDLAAPVAPGRPAYLSAASGLVHLEGRIYVIADDEHHLGIFGREGPGAILELMDGDLPAEAKARKKVKPDFEALARLPAFPGYPHGALLASGSGSKPNRRKSALIGLTADGGPTTVRVIDLDWLMDPLTRAFGKINIEGVTVSKDALCVFQRGNKGHKRNAVVRFSLVQALRSFAAATPNPLTPMDCRDYDLGELNKVPLTFTDGAALPDGGLIFSPPRRTQTTLMRTALAADQPSASSTRMGRSPGFNRRVARIRLKGSTSGRTARRFTCFS